MRNLILAVALLFSTMTFAQTSVKAKTVSLMKQGATMTFAKTTIDYGTIVQGSDRVRTISFTNEGSEALIIKSAKGSCGCTVPTFPKTPIEPGATAEIKVNYDTNRIGSFNKTVTIQTNAGVKSLKVVGKVEKNATVPTKKSGSILDQ